MMDIGYVHRHPNYHFQYLTKQQHHQDTVLNNTSLWNIKIFHNVLEPGDYDDI